MPNILPFLKKYKLPYLEIKEMLRHAQGFSLVHTTRAQ